MALIPSREYFPVELAKPSLHKKDGLESRMEAFSTLLRLHSNTLLRLFIYVPSLPFSPFIASFQPQKPQF